MKNEDNIFKYKKVIIDLYNIWRIDEIMKDIEKEEHEVLEYFLENSIAKVDSKKEDEKYNIKKYIEEKLIKLDLITFNRNSKDLYRDSHYITNKGYKLLNELRNIKYSYWKYILTIVNVVLFIGNIFLVSYSIWLLGKVKGWW